MVSALVVEDDPRLLAFMRETLAGVGLTVRTACDGLQAVNLVQREKFDAVFTDLGMPHLDGFSLIRKIRESDLNGRSLVFIISGTGDTETRQAAFEAGGTFFLEKPVDRTALVRLLKLVRG